MSTKIAKRAADATKVPKTGQVFLWDSELSGFGLRITLTRKTYVVQSQVAGKTVRTTIGTHGALTPDQSVPCISATSILAKVHRDALMLELDGLYPAYGFKDHKGYGTRRHLEVLAQFGATPVHRRSFAPVRNCLMRGV